MVGGWERWGWVGQGWVGWGEVMCRSRGRAHPIYKNHRNHIHPNEILRGLFITRATRRRLLFILDARRARRSSTPPPPPSRAFRFSPTIGFPPALAGFGSFLFLEFVSDRCHRLVGLREHRPLVWCAIHEWCWLVCSIITWTTWMDNVCVRARVRFGCSQNTQHATPRN